MVSGEIWGSEVTVLKNQLVVIGIVFGALMQQASSAASNTERPETKPTAKELLTEAQQDEASQLESKISRVPVEQRTDEAAERLIDSALNKYPNHLEFLKAKADLLIEREDPKGTLAVYDRILVLAPQDCKTYFHRARIKMQLNDLEGAKSDLDTCLRLSGWQDRGSGWMASVLRERGLIEKKFGQRAKAKQDLQDADYLCARQYRSASQMPLNAPKMPFVPRTSYSRKMINLVKSIAEKGQHLSVDELSKLMGFSLISKANEESTQVTFIGGSTEKWSKIRVYASPDGKNVQALYMLANPLFADITSGDVEKVLGNYSPPQLRSTHSPAEYLGYETRTYDLVFYSDDYGATSVNEISITWKTPEQYRQQVRLKEARDKQRTSTGSCAAETIGWLQRLSTLPVVATSEQVNSILKVKFTKYGDFWSCPSEVTHDEVGTPTPDYSVRYQPNGHAESTAQIIIDPGYHTHRLATRTLQDAFGPGTVVDGTTLTPPVPNAEIRSYLFTHCTMRTTHNITNDDGPDQPIHQIEFWWKPPTY